MKTAGRLLVSIGCVIGACVLLPADAVAYGGPGSIVSGVGALLALVAAVLVSVLGFLWFPLKRVYRKIRGEDPEEDVAEAS